MSIFDKFHENVRFKAEVVTRKTEHIVVIFMHKLEIAKIKSELREKYRDLGKIVVKSFISGKNNDEATNKIVKEIDDLYELIDVRLEVLKEIKSIKICKRCGSKNLKDSRFCSQCGKKLDES